MNTNSPALYGTRWVLHGLQRRPELNGCIVNILSDPAHDTRLLVQLENKRLRVLPGNMHSVDDAAVNPNTFLDALRHIRGVENLSEFSTRLDKGDHEGALASAAKWTLQSIANS